MPGFDVEKMFIAAKTAIIDFANTHTQETFYAFSIDANLLCLNSIEKYEDVLNYYLQKYPQYYQTAKEIEELKYNTGDWEYQGFFDLKDGFDQDLYNEHYHIPFKVKNLSEEELESLFNKTPYHQAMESLLTKLSDSKVFELLNKTPDFKIFLSEHNY